jgi:hypothetical protein
MSIGQTTIADASKNIWRSLWKGFLWVLGMMLLASSGIGAC